MEGEILSGKLTNPWAQYEEKRNKNNAKTVYSSTRKTVSTSNRRYIPSSSYVPQYKYGRTPKKITKQKSFSTVRKASYDPNRVNRSIITPVTSAPKVETLADRIRKSSRREIRKATVKMGRVRQFVSGTTQRSETLRGFRALTKSSLNVAKGIRGGLKSLPGPIKRLGVVGGLLVGATAMLGVSMMKGAINQSQDIVYERYMQDQAVGKNILNSSRIGPALGTSRMQNMGSTVGLSNSLSRTRHG